MHYRLAPYCPGSGQFRTACGRVELGEHVTIDRSEVTCKACRASKNYREVELIYPWAGARPCPNCAGTGTAGPGRTSLPHGHPDTRCHVCGGTGEA